MEKLEREVYLIFYDFLYRIYLAKEFEGKRERGLRKELSPSLWTRKNGAGVIPARALFFNNDRNADTTYFHNKYRDYQNHRVGNYGLDFSYLFNAFAYINAYAELIDEQPFYPKDLHKVKYPALIKNEVLAAFANSISHYLAEKKLAPTPNPQDPLTRNSEMLLGQTDALMSNETGLELLNKFAREPLYFYHSTKSADGISYWHCAKMDFTTSKIADNKLETISTFWDISGTYDTPHKVLLSRQHLADLTTIQIIDPPIPTATAILKNARDRDRRIYGFMYHEDWDGELRLSPAILVFEAKAEIQTGSLTSDEGTRLQEEWQMNFGKKITAFTEKLMHASAQKTNQTLTGETKNLKGLNGVWKGIVWNEQESKTVDKYSIFKIKIAEDNVTVYTGSGEFESGYLTSTSPGGIRIEAYADGRHIIFMGNKGNGIVVERLMFIRMAYIDSGKEGPKSGSVIIKRTNQKFDEIEVATYIETDDNLVEFKDELALIRGKQFVVTEVYNFK